MTLPLLNKRPEGGLRKKLKYAAEVSELEVTKQFGPFIRKTRAYTSTSSILPHLYPATNRSAGYKTEPE